MNKEQLQKQAFDYYEGLSRHPMSRQDLQEILCEFAEQYTHSQTETLKKEIEELRGKVEDVKNILNDCVSRDSAVWTINTAREILYKETPPKTKLS